QLRHCRIEIPQCKRYASNGVLPTLQVDRPQRWSQARVHRARVRSVRRAPLAYCPTSSASHASCQHLVDTTAIKIDDLKTPAWWRRRLQDSFIRQLLGSPATNARVESYRRQIGDEPVGNHLRGCWKSNPSPYAEFYFFDDHVDSTFCLRAFEWLAPATTPPP